MIHVKWLIALVICVAASIAGSSYFIEKRTNERGIGLVAEGMIMTNQVYTTLIKTMDEGKCDEARTKLHRLRSSDLRQLADFRQRLKQGSFKRENQPFIDQIDRYLGPDAAK